MRGKLLFFGILYFLQGAGLAYIFNFQKPYLSSQGVSKEAIGLFASLLLIPYIGKVALGYISDRFPIGRWGSRRPYMVMGIFVFGLCFLALSFIPAGENFKVFASVMWVASLGLALFDTCTDGLAVDVTGVGEQSAVQAAMIGGKALGMMLMSWVIGMVATRFGFSSIFLVLAALTFAVLIVVLTVNPRGVKRPPSQMHGWREILRGPFLLFAVFGVVSTIGIFGTDGLMTLHLSEVLGGDSLQVGYFGLLRGLGAIAGAGLFAFLQPHLGLSRSHMAAVVLGGAGCLLAVSPLAGLVSAPLWGLCWGMVETAFVVLAMRFASGPWAATIFALCMIFANIGNALAEALGAPLVPQLGYGGVFAMFALMTWLSVGILVLVYRRSGRILQAS